MVIYFPIVTYFLVKEMLFASQAINHSDGGEVENALGALNLQTF